MEFTQNINLQDSSLNLGKYIINTRQASKPIFIKIDSTRAPANFTFIFDTTGEIRQSSISFGSAATEKNQTKIAHCLRGGPPEFLCALPIIILLDRDSHRSLNR